MTDRAACSPSAIQALSPDIAAYIRENDLTNVHMRAAKRLLLGERRLPDTKITIPEPSKRRRLQPQLFSHRPLDRRIITEQTPTEAHTRKHQHSPHPPWVLVICPCPPQTRYHTCRALIVQLPTTSFREACPLTCEATYSSHNQARDLLRRQHLPHSLPLVAIRTVLL